MCVPEMEIYSKKSAITAKITNETVIKVFDDDMIHENCTHMLDFI